MVYYRWNEAVRPLGELRVVNALVVASPTWVVTLPLAKLFGPWLNPTVP